MSVSLQSVKTFYSGYNFSYVNNITNIQKGNYVKITINIHIIYMDIM